MSLLGLELSWVGSLFYSNIKHLAHPWLLGFVLSEYIEAKYYKLAFCLGTILKILLRNRFL